MSVHSNSRIGLFQDKDNNAIIMKFVSHINSPSNLRIFKSKQLPCSDYFLFTSSIDCDCEDSANTLLQGIIKI